MLFPSLRELVPLPLHAHELRRSGTTWMSITQQLGLARLSPAVHGHPWRSVLVRLDLHVCLLWGGNEPGVPVGMCLLGSPRVGPCLGCATVSSACVCSVRTFPVSNYGGC